MDIENKRSEEEIEQNKTEEKGDNDGIQSGKSEKSDGDDGTPPNDQK